MKCNIRLFKYCGFSYYVGIFAAFTLLISCNADKERSQIESESVVIIQQEEDSNACQHGQNSEITPDESFHIKGHGSSSWKELNQPDRDLEYYDEHFDDYRDDPEDGITYPDEIFDFNED